MDEGKLIQIARDCMIHSYSPYSHFPVAAAILAESGKIYTGVNVENASFGATICAERTAVFKAVSEGERRIAAIAIVSQSEEYIFPCGICRQVLAEFGDGSMKIICSRKNGEYKKYTLDKLLPEAFRL